VTPVGVKPLLIFLGTVAALLVSLALVSAFSTPAVERDRLSPEAYCAAMNAGQNPSVQPGIDCAGA
jgi:hypothetical protein